MTIKKRLVRSNFVMLAVPLLTAGVLALLAAGAMFLLLRENLLTLHDAAEQIEAVLHGFKRTLLVYAAAAALLVLATVAATNYYLTRSLFRSISGPLDTLMAGVARIRDGDLTTPIAYAGGDEFQAACDAVDEMAARLRASLEEQQAEQQKKRELIAGMSHDLKSPLTSIRAYTEALLDGVARDEAARQRYLQTIHTKETEIEGMVNRLFTFARMEASDCPVQSEVLPLRGAVREWTDAWDAEGIAIETDLPPDLTVRADRELLGRILSNLLTNSRKYGGRDVVHVRIAAAADGGMARVTVSDDGPGVPAEQLPRLFDPFYRGDAARTAPGEGSGLGLAVVKKAVEAMGGVVFAAHGEQGGLSVSFTLPLAKEGEHGAHTDDRG